MNNIHYPKGHPKGGQFAPHNLEGGVVSKWSDYDRQRLDELASETGLTKNWLRKSGKVKPTGNDVVGEITFVNGEKQVTETYMNVDGNNYVLIQTRVDSEVELLEGGTATEIDYDYALYEVYDDGSRVRIVMPFDDQGWIVKNDEIRAEAFRGRIKERILTGELEMPTTKITATDPMAVSAIENVRKAKAKKDVNRIAKRFFEDYGIRMDTVNFGGDLEQSKARAEAIIQLTSEYKTHLGKKAERGRGGKITSQQKSGGRVGTATTSFLVIDGVVTAEASINFTSSMTGVYNGRRYKADNSTAHSERRRKVADADGGFSATVHQQHALKYTAYHEFAHTIFTSWTIKRAEQFGLDAPHKEFYGEICKLFNEYKAECAIGGGKNSVLGEYAKTNENEFLAEAFTHAKLSKHPCPLGQKVLDLIDAEFRR